MPAPSAGAPREETFELAGGNALLGIVMLLFGLVVAGICGLSLLGGPSAFSFALFGFGLAFTGGGYAVATNRQGLRRLTIGPEGATILSRDGSSATLPCAVLEGARVHMVTQRTSSSGSSTTSVTYYVHLRKRDGGAIDLGAQRNQAEAQRLAADITAALERSRPATEPAPQDAVAILRGSPHLTVRREDGEASADYRRAARPGDLVISWSLRPTQSEVVPAVLVPLGFVSALWGIQLENRSPFVLVLAVAVAALFLFILVRLVTRLGASQVLRISDAELTAAELRGGRPADKKSIPLPEITAVDFSLSTTTIGGTLQLRRNHAKLVQPPESPGAGALVDLVKQAIDLHRNSVNIPLGRLPFGDRVRVDLAVSAEIAQRTGRNDADL